MHSGYAINTPQNNLKKYTQSLKPELPNPALGLGHILSTLAVGGRGYWRRTIGSSLGEGGAQLASIRGMKKYIVMCQRARALEQQLPYSDQCRKNVRFLGIGRYGFGNEPVCLFREPQRQLPHQTFGTGLQNPSRVGLSLIHDSSVWNRTIEN